MRNKNEKANINKLTGQMHGQSAELTDDDLDSVSGGLNSSRDERRRRMREEACRAVEQSCMEQIQGVQDQLAGINAEIKWYQEKKEASYRALRKDN